MQARATRRSVAVDDVLRRHRMDAIMLHRAWPPTDMPAANSRLGGLPSLPKGLAWPRSKASGLPLHFLAQIDLTELPPNGLLPTQGMLFFFAMVDEEMVWDGDPAEYSRVLFDPSPVRAGTVAMPPPNLPAIEGGYTDLTKSWVLPGEAHATIYPRWPVLAHAISSWPDAGGVPEYRSIDISAYHDERDRLRAEEALRASGMTIGKDFYPRWATLKPEADGTLPAGWADDIGPHVWIMIERIARSLAKRCADMRTATDKAPPDRPTGFDRDHVAAVFGAAKGWMDRARKAGFTTGVLDEDRIAFLDWLGGLMVGADKRMATLARDALTSGVTNTVRYAASSRAVADLLSPGLIEQFAQWHTPVAKSSLHSDAPLEARHHQMLGRAPSSQESFGVDSPKIMLLQLTSDYGVDFMFCDLGEIEFWIEPEDLIARRFDKVEAYTCGG